MHRHDSSTLGRSVRRAGFVALAAMLAACGGGAKLQVGSPDKTAAQQGPATPVVSETATKHFNEALQQFAAHDRANDWSEGTCVPIAKAFLDAAGFPAITFKSTKVEPTGANTANVTGDLTLHGVTKPVVLAVTFNGGYAPNAYDGARIGFSAKGAFRRSDFGVGAGLPAPGSNMGVGDQVNVIIETEFGMGKPTAPAPAQ